MANPIILIVNTFITVILVWMALNYCEVVDKDPFEWVAGEFRKVVYYSQLDGSVMAPAETYMSVPEIIKNRGYPLEVHHVVTADGYILELHRIPRSSNDRETGQSPDTNKKRAVLLQHGIFATDFVWTSGANDKSLAFVLADKGYDVWMGNSRGNTYSRKHKTLDVNDPKYWDFTWDELGQHDIPAMVDYILSMTGQKKISYVGYSLGCALFFVGANLNPKLNEKIEVMVGIAPTSTVQRLDNLFKIIAPFSTPLKYAANWTNTGLVLPIDGIPSRALRYICNSTHIGSAFCQMLNLYIFGYSETTNTSIVHIMTGHYPGGGSPKTMFQFFDNYNAGGNFARFDYGETENKRRYGSVEAPKYQMELVTAPVYLIWSQTDPVASPEDVEWLSKRLGNLKGSIRVEADVFSHGDFFMSTKVSELVFQPLLKLLPPAV